MPKSRRSFSREAKQAIVNDLLSGKYTPDEIEKKHDVDRYMVYRWRDRLLAEKNTTATESEDLPKLPKVLSNGTIDPRDRVIMQLKVKLADMMLELERLRAEIHGHKRFTDKELYKSSRGIE